MPIDLTYIDFAFEHNDIDQKYDSEILDLVWNEAVAFAEKHMDTGFTIAEAVDAVATILKSSGLAVLQLDSIVEEMFLFMQERGALGGDSCANYVEDVTKIVWRHLGGDKRYEALDFEDLAYRLIILIEMQSDGVVETERIVEDMVADGIFDRVPEATQHELVGDVFDFFVSKKIIAVTD